MPRADAHESLAFRSVLRTYADGRLFGEGYGDEPAEILALHGWARDRSDFGRVLEGRRAVALDQPGFGASPVPDHAGGAQMYADLVEPVLDRMADRIVVVGHSFGGRVACHLAVAHPERVAALVLTGVPLLFRTDRTATVKRSVQISRWLHRRGLLSDERMEEQRRRHGSTDYRNATGVMRDVLVRVVNEDYADLLPRIQVPVELVWARHDAAVPLEVAERAAEALPSARLTVVEDAAHHDLPMVAAGQLGAAIDRAVEQRTTS